MCADLTVAGLWEFPFSFVGLFSETHIGALSFTYFLLWLSIAYVCYFYFFKDVEPVCRLDVDLCAT